MTESRKELEMQVQRLAQFIVRTVPQQVWQPPNGLWLQDLTLLDDLADERRRALGTLLETADAKVNVELLNKVFDGRMPRMP